MPTLCERMRKTKSSNTMPIAPKAQARRKSQGRSAPATRKPAMMAKAFCHGRIGDTVTGHRFATPGLSPPLGHAENHSVRRFFLFAVLFALAGCGGGASAPQPKAAPVGQPT